MPEYQYNSMCLFYLAEWNADYINLLHHNIKMRQVQEDSCGLHISQI